MWGLCRVQQANYGGLACFIFSSRYPFYAPVQPTIEPEGRKGNIAILQTNSVLEIEGAGGLNLMLRDFNIGRSVNTLQVRCVALLILPPLCIYMPLLNIKKLKYVKCFFLKHTIT